MKSHLSDYVLFYSVALAASASLLHHFLGSRIPLETVLIAHRTLFYAAIGSIMVACIGFVTTSASFVVGVSVRNILITHARKGIDSIWEEFRRTISALAFGIPVMVFGLVSDDGRFPLGWVVPVVTFTVFFVFIRVSFIIRIVLRTLGALKDIDLGISTHPALSDSESEPG